MKQWLEPAVLMSVVALLIRAVYLLGNISNQFKMIVETQKQHGEDIEELKTGHAELKGIVHAAYSKRSLTALENVHPDLRKVLEHAIGFTDFVVLEGYRSPERQRRLFAAGASKIDGVKKKGKHNYFPSLAVDLAPYPIDFKNVRRYHDLAQVIFLAAKHLGIEIRWGGDWDRDGDTKDQTFNYIGHFELYGKVYER